MITIVEPAKSDTERAQKEWLSLHMQIYEAAFAVLTEIGVKDFAKDALARAIADRSIRNSDQ